MQTYAYTQLTYADVCIHTAVLLHGGQELNKEDLVKLLGSDMPGVST
jgi:hypothetical protein